MTTYTMAGPLPDQPDPDAELLIPNDALPELMKRRLRPADVYLMSLRLLVACQAQLLFDLYPDAPTRRMYRVTANGLIRRIDAAIESRERDPTELFLHVMRFLTGLPYKHLPDLRAKLDGAEVAYTALRDQSNLVNARVNKYIKEKE